VNGIGITGTEKSRKAFKITANRPITVYQFNPLDNEQVFSNDASLLLPAPNLGTEYRVMSYQQMGTTFRPFFAIVGISAGITKVDIRPKSRTLAGTGIPAVEKDALATHHIEYGEVLNIEGDQAGGDLTGTHILSDKPVAVFGGHEATNMVSVCCADHLEQQLVPVAAWGKKYIISKAFERWMERDYVRVVASQDFTTVSLNPAVATVPELRAGEHYTFTTNANVMITANKPVMVAQFLAASHEILGSYTDEICFDNGDCAPGYKCDDWLYECEPPSCTTGAGCPSGHTCESYGISGGYCEPIGDPSMMLAVPEEQFLDSYVFLAPDAYLRDYINIIAPLDANTVMLDGKQIPLSQFVPVSSSGFGVYRTEISDGIHTLTSDKKVGVMVYGYDNDVSYGYPGGMGLGQQ
jgi:hypothetical protein